MSKETKIMWFGSFLGGFVLLLFSAIGLSQYCKSVELKTPSTSDRNSRDKKN